VSRPQDGSPVLAARREVGVQGREAGGARHGAGRATKLHRAPGRASRWPWRRGLVLWAGLLGRMSTAASSRAGRGCLGERGEEEREQGGG
jgi:hypothetical protein